MPYCSSCGNELRGEEKFCAQCGQLAPGPGAAAAAADSASVTPGAGVVTAAAGEEIAAVTAADDSAAASVVPPPFVPAAYPPPPPPPTAPRRSMKWVWIGGGAAVAVIAIVCVLVFVVFDGGGVQEAEDVSTTPQAAPTTLVTVPVAVTGTTSVPTSTTAQTAPPTSTVATAAADVTSVEKAVRAAFAALENQDIDALLGVMDPAILGLLPAGEALDAAKAAIKAEMAAMGTMKFSGVEMKTEMTSPTTATVTLTAGIVTVTDANGQVTSEDVKDSTSPVTIDMALQNGQWYMASSPFL